MILVLVLVAGGDDGDFDDDDVEYRDDEDNYWACLGELERWPDGSFRLK